jgi:hypothetical protein
MATLNALMPAKQPHNLLFARGLTISRVFRGLLMLLVNVRAYVCVTNSMPELLSCSATI